MSNPADQVTMSRYELERLVEHTVKTTLTSLGIDSSNPTAVQRDFQALRDWRLATEQIKRKGLFTMLGIILAGVAGLLVLGLRAWIKSV